MKPGDVCFFKQANCQPSEFPRGVKFQGWGFGVVLGNVPPGVPAPPASHLFRLMANAGYSSFDDVIEFLGEEKGKQFVQWFEMKYFGRTSEDAAKEGAPGPEDIEPPKLVGLDGRPLDRLTTKRLAITDYLPEPKP